MADPFVLREGEARTEKQTVRQGDSRAVFI